MKGRRISVLIALLLVIAVASGFIVWRCLESRVQDSGVIQNDQDEITPIFGDPPDISVALSVFDAYLGDYPEATFTVTNSGRSCTVSYTIFETAPQTGSFSLGGGESETITVTGPQVRDIGAWSTSVQVAATNSYGSDSASDWANFSVDIEPFDAMPYVEQDELASARDGIMRALRETWRRLSSLFSQYRADAYTQFITPDSPTVKMIADQLSSRHPYDRELQAKEIYYWLVNWVSFDHEYAGKWDLQATWPVETIADRTGVCINYSMTLASLYEAVGLDTKLIVMWGGQPVGHAIILLFYPGLDYAYYPFEDGWMALDPTNCPMFGKYHPYGYEQWDMVSL